ncbi:MAG TPA: hotdog domain-containing protein [Acidimicrobiales bacterium]|nr:hotdog domain-containing protein [Acidimicrobiales bacterium]
MSVKQAMSGAAELVVAWEDTAAAARSGDVPVLATPRVVALCEEASVHALAGYLPEGHTSVGTRVEMAHLAAVAVGSAVRAVATLEKTEGRRLVFSVSVTDRCGLVAVGKVTRVVVERDHFVHKAR